MRDLRECAVAVVMKELHGLGAVAIGVAIGARFGLRATADGVAARLPVAIVRDKQIDIAVVVVVDPARAHRPCWLAQRARAREACNARDVSKRAVAVIAIKKVPVYAGDKEVFVAVVVVVAHGHAHAVSLPLQAGLFRDIGEGAVAIVAIESVPVFGSGLGERRKRSAVGAEQIGPAIAIEVNDTEAAGQRFHLVLASGRAVAQDEIQARGAGAVHHANLWRRCWSA